MAWEEFRRTRRKYTDIWNRVAALGSGQSLTVNCKTASKAKLLYMAAMTHRTKRIQANVRGQVVCLKNRARS